MDFVQQISAKMSKGFFIRVQCKTFDYHVFGLNGDFVSNNTVTSEQFNITCRSMDIQT